MAFKFPKIDPNEQEKHIRATEVQAIRTSGSAANIRVTGTANLEGRGAMPPRTRSVMAGRYEAGRRVVTADEVMICPNTFILWLLDQI